MVKPCENEECGRPFIARRRDTRFCSASCRARAHTLKNRRERLLARARPGAGGEAAVNTPTIPATARLERIHSPPASPHPPRHPLSPA